MPHPVIVSNSSPHPGGIGSWGAGHVAERPLITVLLHLMSTWLVIVRVGREPEAPATFWAVEMLKMFCRSTVLLLTTFPTMVTVFGA